MNVVYHNIPSEKRIVSISGLAIGMAILAGCSNPADETYTTNATSAQPVPEISEDEAGATYALDATKAVIGWIGSKPGGSHSGGFNDLDGELLVNAAGDGIAALKATIQIESMHSDNSGLTSHLLNEDFFDQPTHPTSAFEATEVRAITADDDSGEVEGATHMVTGNFTMIGETRSITFPAIVAIDDESVTLDTTFDINRSQWGMDFGLADAAIRDEVVISLKIDTAAE